MIDLLSQATLEPGDEIVCGWPSFPSYVLDAAKMGAVVRKVPLRDHTYDLDGLLAAVGPRTKLVYVCHPNNPTGTANGRDELVAFVDRVPERTSHGRSTRRTSSTSTTRTTRTGSTSYFKSGRRVAVLRTFSKIYGLAGLRVGYGVAPADVVTATSKVRRAFDVTATGAGGRAREHRRRRRARAAARAQRARAAPQLEAILRAHGLDPVGPAVGNFLFADVGDGAAVFDRLLREGVDRPPARAASARPRRSASPSARRTRTRSSPPRSDTSFRASRRSARNAC